MAHRDSSSALRTPEVIGEERMSGSHQEATRRIDLRVIPGAASKAQPEGARVLAFPAREAFPTREPASAVRAKSEARANDDTQPAPPPRLGRYEVVAPLASGGMAEVLLARLAGPGGIRIPVVIKRPHPHLAGDRHHLSMFLDEARIASRVRHPNVARVHELFEVDGAWMLAMEWVEGESLAQMLRFMEEDGERLSFELAAYIVSEIAAGLHAAHETRVDDGRHAEVVHRDVSPHNVVIASDGSVKLVDFGVAKSVDKSSHTQAGQIKGKLEYLAPEQVACEPLDCRADVFALGAVLFECTTGDRLFRRDSRLETLRAILRADVPRPSRCVPGYPEELERIVVKCLRAERTERYASAAEVRRDLRNWLARSARGRALEEETATLARRYFGEAVEARRMLVTKGPAITIGSEPQLPAAPPLAATVAARPGGRRALGERRFASPIAIRTLVAVGAAVAIVLGAAAGFVAARVTTAERHSLSSAEGTAVLAIESDPAGALVSIDGEPVGQTPLSVAITRSESPVALEVRRGDSVAWSRVTPDHDQQLRFELAQ